MKIYINPSLSWTGSEPLYINSTIGGSKYNIWRKKNSGSYSKIKNLHTTLTYSDGSITTPGFDTFYYKIRGRNSDDTKHSVSYSNVDSESGTDATQKIAIGGSNIVRFKELRVSNYPNPFNPETSITFSLPEESKVRLLIFNLLGRQVAVLADGRFPAGEHTIKWDGSNNASGLYYYTLTAGNEFAVGSMMLTK